MLEILEHFTTENKEQINKILQDVGWGEAVSIFKTIAKRTSRNERQDAENTLRIIAQQKKVLFENYDVGYMVFDMGYNSKARESLFVLYFAFFEPSHDTFGDLYKEGKRAWLSY